MSMATMSVEASRERTSKLIRCNVLKPRAAVAGSLLEWPFAHALLLYDVIIHVGSQRAALVDFEAFMMENVYMLGRARNALIRWHAIGMASV